MTFNIIENNITHKINNKMQNVRFQYTYILIITIYSSSSLFLNIGYTCIVWFSSIPLYILITVGIL